MTSLNLTNEGAFIFPFGGVLFFFPTRTSFKLVLDGLGTLKIDFTRGVFGSSTLNS